MHSSPACTHVGSCMHGACRTQPYVQLCGNAVAQQQQDTSNQITLASHAAAAAEKLPLGLWPEAAAAPEAPEFNCSHVNASITRAKTHPAQRIAVGACWSWSVSPACRRAKTGIKKLHAAPQATYTAAPRLRALQKRSPRNLNRGAYVRDRARRCVHACSAAPGR